MTYDQKIKSYDRIFIGILTRLELNEKLGAKFDRYQKKLHRDLEKDGYSRFIKLLSSPDLDKKFDGIISKLDLTR